MCEQLCLEDLTTSCQLLPDSLELADHPFGFAGPKSTDELQHGVHVLMVEEQVEIDTDLIDNLDVDFFETISESSLVHKLLHWVKSQSQSLILSIDWAPEIQDFTEWVLLEPCE